MGKDDIIIRQMQQSDIQGAEALKRAENWNQTKEDWQMLLSLYPRSCFVACNGSTIVGTVTATNYGNQVAWIGMMLVSKDFRERGISTRLLKTIIENLGVCRSIKLDATPAGFPVYQKLGFNEELQIDRMVASKVRIGQSDAIEFSARRFQESDMTAIRKLDFEVFGTDRHPLLEILFNRNEERSWLVERDNKVVGFALVRPGYNFLQLGPLFAETIDDAKCLVTHVMGQFVGQSLVVDVLSDKEELKNLLTSFGFSGQRSFVRMFLKSNTFSGTVKKQFLIAGPELG